jgi:hypothetical protein
MKTAFLMFLLAISVFIPQVALADRKPPADAKALSEIVLSLEKRGYIPIVDIEFEDGRWEIEAYREGRKRDLKVDPRSGVIISDHHDD